ncbi:bifunctional 23S rRNA (guanine(2069)-N(7))-methyltransferase RlmK/23S rRNA (guanine(2445)-N(2))-methyltransferase RlmL [Sediminispirochaeta bajacaliforniensis]|uniref:bifunctional 23S rRNA (guanine(2069)-N(7))-methyltransferase RlmK/23S rRNA (guanine(2445)-N(2))-methyltransferase RlmL n=1 Tax=Sediminispirochaeta bajacaliforniensis TaxID=148 RepID=UPI00037A2027|nr:bifunctional 23S rRNA (guanine(2069)-N(7))-methyltransferase RlmK/23S rRNA (guanine(2445)-N(2))-methyltransferase RlmL [Sediminispirochaeta bajacaliforniensis]
MIVSHTLFAPSAKHCSDIVADEAALAGGEVLAILPGGVSFRGNLETMYRFCLNARVASSLILSLGRFAVEEATDLYRAANSIDWPSLFPVRASFAVDAAGKRDRAVEHTGYAARVVKDAIADRFRDACGARPSVDTAHPDITINLFIERKAVSIGIDLAGEALHRRGYRKERGEVVLRETVAAAALVRAGWKGMAGEGKPFVDPFCGSGTLLIEAALAAGDIAPGLFRRRFGFESLKGHDSQLWERMKKEAEEIRHKGLKRIPVIKGYDIDPAAVAAAAKNIAAAGLRERIEVKVADARFLDPGALREPGLLLCDPPYGKRSDLKGKALEGLYRSFGENLKLHFGGWKIGVVAGDEARNYHIGLKPEKVNTLFNGPVECSLGLYQIREREQSPGGAMAANRLKKNMKRLKRWLLDEGITCFRLYDADMPEYAAAIDLYESVDNDRWIHLQEYVPPASIDPAAAARRLGELVDATSDALGIARSHIVVKRRRRQRGTNQYAKFSETGREFEVFENGLRFLVNLHDYLDTGIFLDHRPLRRTIMETAQDKRFLNLFCYTGTVSVHAAAGSAARTTSVDNSNTYLNWAGRNMALNGFQTQFGDKKAKHRLIKADCLTWLETAAKQEHGAYDLIFLDPPTFSNSKNMDDTFDVQRDHPKLIEWCMELLAPGGLLLFSTNRKGFVLELKDQDAREITDETIDPDFLTRKAPHLCWTLQK